MFVENHLPVQRTARYYTYGRLHAETKKIWIVCHGYGQLAKNIIASFQGLDQEEHYVIAPEALSRFYWNGFSNKAVASWMTSEDRAHEIQDYVNYLDQVYEKTMPLDVDNRPPIHVIGFSQGATTVSRWIGQGKAQPDYLTLWAGQLAHDLDWAIVGEKFRQLKQLFIVYGDQDQFVKKAFVEKQQVLLKEQGVASRVIVFEGKHKLNEGVLKQLSEL